MHHILFKAAMREYWSDSMPHYRIHRLISSPANLKVVVVVVTAQQREFCSPFKARGAEVLLSLWGHIIQHVRVCERVRRFPRLAPSISIVLSVVESGYVCLLSEESLCEVVARCASTSAVETARTYFLVSRLKLWSRRAPSPPLLVVGAEIEEGGGGL